MPRQGATQTAAQFLYEQGWDRRIVLRGMPIMRNGKQVEPGVTLVVTAVGDESVLGAAGVDGFPWQREGVWTFDSREWYVNGQEPQDSGTP